MEAPRICCEPCDRIGLCSSDRNCCLECHFSLEEELALPWLPPQLQQRIRYEHALLEQLGFPKGEVEAHARWEEYVFRIYEVPEPILQRITGDHHAYDEGQLVSRERAPRVQNPDPGLLRMQRVRG